MTHLKKNLINPFLLKTSYIGPKFTNTFSSERPSMSLEVYVNNNNEYYVYSNYTFQNVSRASGDTSVYKLKNDLNKDAEFNFNAIYKNNTSGFGGSVHAIYENENGVFILGSFSNYSSNTVLSSPSGITYLVKLDKYGKVDTTFCKNAIGELLNGQVISYIGIPKSLIAQADGKVLIAGDVKFTNKVTGEIGTSRLIRVNVDGTPDLPFCYNVRNLIGSISGIPTPILALFKLSEKIFYAYREGSVVIKIFNPDGSLDSIFTNIISNSLKSLSGSSIRCVHMQEDGKIIIGGSFIRSGFGNASVIRFNADGTEDLIFTNAVSTRNGVGLFNREVTSIVETPDSKLYFSGGFSQWTTDLENKGLSYLISFNADLTLNNSFNDIAVRTGESSNFYNTTNIVLDKNSQLVVSCWLDSGTSNFNSIVDYKGNKFLNYLLILNPVNGSLNLSKSKKISIGTRVSKFSGSISAIEFSSLDNSYVFGGSFYYGEKIYRTSISNTLPYNLIKLNSAGEEDKSFTTNSRFLFSSKADQISSITYQADGKSLVAGSFTTGISSGISNISYFVRLNSDGTLDIPFAQKAIVSNNNTRRFNNTISTVFIQTDEKILIGGAFLSYVSDSNIKTGKNNLIRLNKDGTEDDIFTNNAVRASSTAKIDDYVTAVYQLSTGKILIGGYFQNYAGNSGINALAMVAEDGTLGLSELSFTNVAIRNGTTRKFSGIVNSIAEQSDGKILIGGYFTNYGGVTGYNHLVRLHPDGTLDTPFMENIKSLLFGSNINKIVVENSGNIFLCGHFSYGTTAQSLQGFLRLSPDGTLDLSFNQLTLNTKRKFIVASFTPINTVLKTPNNNYMIGMDSNSFANNARDFDRFDSFVMLDNSGNVSTSRKV